MALNPQQHEAVTYTQGPLLVIAGAGSGKTRVITNKIAYLIEKCGLFPEHIYAVTFTNKAAKEMASRITQHKISISTFHSLGLCILKKENATLALKKNFTLFDTLDSFNLVKSLSEKIMPLTDEQTKSVCQHISRWKNNLIHPTQEAELSSEAQSAAHFFDLYCKTLLAYNAVDFDDLIALPVRLFQENSDRLAYWQNKIRYLLVDEYQDTNRVQYRLIQQLCGIRQAFTVVGDDDQSIYGWRGAKSDNLNLLQDDFPQLKVIKLEQNYRSTRTILSAANHLISHNTSLFEKKLWSNLGVGEPIKIIATSNDEAEAERIVHELIAHRFQSRHPLHDYAIFYRSNYQSRLIEQVLREHHLPYQMSGGISFFSRSEIKDLFAYFRLMINPDDDAAFLRCINTPKRDIGPVTLEKLGHYASSRHTSLFHACFEMGLSDYLGENAQQRLYQFVCHIDSLAQQVEQDEALIAIEEFIKDIHYISYLADTAPTPRAGEKRIEHVNSLLKWIARLMSAEQEGFTFKEAIQRIALVDLLDRQASEEKGQAIQLMTLHAAKGLEFPHVFIMGWEEEILPHKTSIALDMVEEERRLAYVGMTRAQQTLVLTYAKQRKRFGEMLSTTPSRFLEELPADLVQIQGQVTCEATQRAQGVAHLNTLKNLLEIPS